MGGGTQDDKDLSPMNPSTLNPTNPEKLNHTDPLLPPFFPKKCGFFRVVSSTHTAFTSRYHEPNPSHESPYEVWRWALGHRVTGLLSLDSREPSRALGGFIGGLGSRAF